MAVWKIYRDKKPNLRRTFLFIEQIKTLIFLEAFLEIKVMHEPQSNLEKKKNPSLLKDNFFNIRPTHFYINSASVIRTIKQNKLSIPCTEINKPLPASFQSLMGQIQVHKPTLVIVCIGISTLLKSTTPLFHQAPPPLNLRTVKACHFS